MSLEAFKAWLSGYLEGGGTDLSLIQQKLGEVPQDPPKFWFVPKPRVEFVPYLAPYVSDHEKWMFTTLDTTAGDPPTFTTTA